MKVRDVMTTEVCTVGPDASYAEILDCLLDNEISGVPVVHPGGRLLGMVTEADLVSGEAYGHRRRRALELMAGYLRGQDPQWLRKAAGTTAEELMTSPPSTASPDDDIAVAARHMLESSHKRLPVVVDGKIIGIVSRHDLLRGFDLPENTDSTA
jgi:CBS domain-containing protein